MLPRVAMGELVPLSIARDPVCGCGHGRSLHGHSGCRGCGAWSTVPWRDKPCESFGEPSQVDVAYAGGPMRRSREAASWSVAMRFGNAKRTFVRPSSGRE
jgi:hypothetical protein